MFLVGSLLNKSSLKQWIKCNIKAFFIGGLISLVISVSATIILHSNQVEYKDGKSVETSVNELYQKTDQLGLLEMKKIGCQGCTRLEYLESTGVQYIDTGVRINGQYNIYTKIQFTNIRDGSWERIFGGRTSWHDSSFYVVKNLNDNKLIFYYGNNDFPTTTIAEENIIYNISYVDNNFIVNDDITLVKRSNFIATGKYYLFNCNLYKNEISEIPYLKMYYFKIYDNDTLICDYIPVLDANNRPCLFDKVSKTCFYNQGDGEDFLYG